MLNFSMDIDNGELTVSLEGRLDAVTARDLDAKMEEVLDGIKAITIDCAKLELISSAGLRTILAAEQYLEENDCGDVKVINANDVITGIFEETGFTGIVDLVR